MAIMGGAELLHQIMQLHHVRVLGVAKTCADIAIIQRFYIFDQEQF